MILAETKRTSPDLPEAEAELVVGFNVEYRSLLCTLFFGGYRLMFLGWGWNGDRPLDNYSS